MSKAMMRAKDADLRPLTQRIAREHALAARGRMDAGKFANRLGEILLGELECLTSGMAAVAAKEARAEGRAEGRKGAADEIAALTAKLANYEAASAGKPATIETPAVE